MKKSVRKRRKVSGIVLKKSGNAFMLTKRQFWIWGLGISFALIFLAFAVDYFNNSAYYKYGVNDNGFLSGAGELYNGPSGGNSGAGQTIVVGKGQRCGPVKIPGSPDRVDVYKCDQCLTCGELTAVIKLFTQLPYTSTIYKDQNGQPLKVVPCPPCALLEASQEFKDFKNKYPVEIIDINVNEDNPKAKDNKKNQLQAQCYGVRATPTFIVVDTKSPKGDCVYDDNGVQKKFPIPPRVNCGPFGISTSYDKYNAAHSSGYEPISECYLNVKGSGICIPAGSGSICKGPPGSSGDYKCDKDGNCIPPR